MLQIHLLGRFEVNVDGEPLTSLRQIRLQSLLAYLILQRQAPQSRRHLAFLFWPDSNEKQAQGNLRKALSALRGALPTAELFLAVDGHTVQWRPDAPWHLDVDQFEQHLGNAARARQGGDATGEYAELNLAVEIYEGDLLPDCYDDWVVARREHLRERFLEALARLVDGLEQAREYAAAIRQANRLLRLDPLHEETYCRLMRLHVLCDDRASALRTYHTCAAALQRELGVEPSPRTQEAYARLFYLETAPRTPSPELARRTRAGLVGRNAEWQQLMLAWARAAAGRARFLLIGGESGIGKTRLVEEVLQWAAQQGYATAYARAYAAEGRLAYDPIAEWLRSEDIRRRVEALDDIWLEEIVRLAPELRVHRRNLRIPQPLTESWQRRHFFEALARGVLSGPAPLLLALDDLQWCDRETLEWLHYVLRYDAQSRLLVVGAARMDEIDDDHPLHVLLHELRQTQQLTDLALHPLDVHETVQLAQQVRGQAFDADQAARLFRVTEGNPLLILETIRAETPDRQMPDFAGREAAAGLPPLPAKTQAVIEMRLAHLSPAARGLAALAATIGRSFTFAILRQAGGEDDDRLVAALDELWRRRIVREHGSDGYDFSHDKIREVAYAGISPMRRQRLHLQVAEALEHLHAGELHKVSARIAAHYRQAGEVAKAATFYLHAARDMQFGYAYEETTTHLRQGLALLKGQAPTLENTALEIAMLLALGRVLTASEGWGNARVLATFEAARRLCLQANNAAQLIRVQDYLQIAYGESGDIPGALALAESTLALATKLGGDAEVREAHGGLGLLLWDSGRFEAAHRHLEQAAAMATESPEAQADAPLTLCYSGAFPHALVRWLLGYPDSARHYLQEVVAAQEPRAGPFDHMSGYEFCVMFYHWSRDFGQMETYAQKLLAVTQEYEYAMYEWLGRLYVAAAASALGARTISHEQLRQAIDAITARGTRMHVPYALYLLAEVCMRGEQAAAAGAALDEALAMSLHTGEHLWDAETHRLRGELLAAQGLGQEAEYAYQQALAVARQQGAKALELRAATSLGRLWQAQGRDTQVQALLSPIFAWFTEGFDTPDLQAAQALLAAPPG